MLLKHDLCPLDTLSNHLSFEDFFHASFHIDLKRSLSNFKKISSFFERYCRKPPLRVEGEGLQKLPKLPFGVVPKLQKLLNDPHL